MNTVLIVFTIVSAIATVAIACLTYQIIKLTKTTEENTTTHQKEMIKLQTKLTSAIVYSLRKEGQTFRENDFKIIYNQIDAMDL